MKRLVRTVVVLATFAASMVVTVGTAQASVGIGTSLSGPSAAAVGQTGLPGSVTAINTNTAPNQSETNTLTTVKIALSCGAAPAPPNPCPTPDPGVFSMAPTASGAAATACAGVTFSASAPDPSGVVTFTSGSTIILSPPGGPTGSDRCTINYSFSVLKMPATDTNLPATGTQTRVNARLQVTSSPSGLMPAGNPTLEITVVPATPGLSTHVAKSPVVRGASVSDTATVTGVSGVATPTGNVTFRLYGPGDASCSAAPVTTSTNALAAGSAQSTPFVPATIGTYRYTAAYSGDANYAPVQGPCGAANESVLVLASASRPPDFDGNGTTDIAVFRPSTGMWYVQGQASTHWGGSTDIPVPGDYNGNGTTDIGIFRASNGMWYVQGQADVHWGGSTDIPVPGDYDGNGTTDIAIFRPSTGTWYVQGQPAVVLGTSGDIPVPGDYDGNGTTDIAVFRPSTGTWYVQGQAPVAFGASGDRPLPLPAAIRRVFFP